MQSYIKSELNVMVNSITNLTDSNQTTPFCRKKLDFATNNNDSQQFNEAGLSRANKPKHKNTAIVTGTIQPSYSSPNEAILCSKSSVRNPLTKTPSNSKRNARERRRVRTINDYFSQLQKFLPHTKQVSTNGPNSTQVITTSKKMSKVETLKAAIEYIEYLIKFAPANQKFVPQASTKSANSHTTTNSNTTQSCSSSSPSSLLSSPASSVTSSSSTCSNSTQLLVDKFKTSLKSPNKQALSSPCSPNTLHNSSYNSSCPSPVSHQTKNPKISQTTQAYESCASYFNQSNQYTQHYSQSPINVYNSYAYTNSPSSSSSTLLNPIDFNTNYAGAYQNSTSTYYYNQTQYSGSQYPIDPTHGGVYADNQQQLIQHSVNSYGYYSDPSLNASDMPDSDAQSPVKQASSSANYQNNLYQYCSKQQTYELKSEIYLNECVDSNLASHQLNAI